MRTAVGTLGKALSQESPRMRNNASAHSRGSEVTSLRVIMGDAIPWSGSPTSLPTARFRPLRHLHRLLLLEQTKTFSRLRLSQVCLTWNASVICRQFTTHTHTHTHTHAHTLSLSLPQLHLSTYTMTTTSISFFFSFFSSSLGVSSFLLLLLLF